MKKTYKPIIRALESDYITWDEDDESMSPRQRKNEAINIASFCCPEVANIIKKYDGSICYMRLWLEHDLDRYFTKYKDGKYKCSYVCNSLVDLDEEFFPKHQQLLLNEVLHELDKRHLKYDKKYVESLGFKKLYHKFYNTLEGSKHEFEPEDDDIKFNNPSIVLSPKDFWKLHKNAKALRIYNTGSLPDDRYILKGCYLVNNVIWNWVIDLLTEQEYFILQSKRKGR